MTDFYDECKKWIIWVQKLDLDNIIKSLKNIRNLKQDSEVDRYLFKLLLCLSHCADRCYKEQLCKEIQIFIIANITCENLISVPDKNKFFSAVYYIVYYLLSKEFFKEAKCISSYLFPGKIVDADNCYDSSQYYQIALLWHTALLKKLDKLIAVKIKKENIIDEEYCSYVTFHLQILKFCDESSCYTFKTVETYVKKLANVPLTIAFPCLILLFKHLCYYISHLKNFSLVEAYKLTILSVGLAFYKRNDSIDNSNILNYFRQCDNYFLESLKISSESYNCYKLFREYSINLFETNFMSNEIGKLRFKKISEILNFLIQKYGVKNNSLIETATAIALSFEVLFSNWENLVSKQLKTTNISYEDIESMGYFVKQVYNIFKNRLLPTTYTCKKCPESTKCSMKTDVVNATIPISAYLKVITKFSLDNLDEKIFTITKELLEELVLAFNELDKSGCKNSLATWDTCGRSIFNIGLISEDKYSAHLEELYEVLCAQIVRRDGLNSKISSFGLENPVGTSLHRLCNSNFNQEKYRKAMSYTAYNALLSNNESRIKKAYDMWANIKLKLTNSKEIQELTIVKCLETDIKVVQKLGINLNLKDYDLSDVCLRELKSLYQIKSNMILAMKTVLSELESRNNGLQYAQGVLLLCFHAMQLNKREFISNHISKAIDKLKKLKLNTVGNQCLLANLNFFNIIEKLYSRSQIIKKHIDDTNFTIKTFKMIRGKQLDYQDDNDDEVVPTYEGITIKEDNKCAAEMRDILTMWGNCLEKNLNGVITDWEPTFTLETIVICGEYCRLYKFNRNEEKAWQLAYNLADGLQDFRTCIYVTSRSISLRYINDTWISKSEKYVEDIKNSSKTADTETVGLFWLSLADFYLDCKKVKEAKLLLEKVKEIPNYEILSNSKIYIYAAGIRFRNYYLLNEQTSQEDYCNLMVEIHYSLINLHDVLTQEICRFWNIRFQLFSCEKMLDSMCDIVIPMNSLLSYREVSAHLAYGLEFVQTLGMTLRIAQYLKYFCYIDLLRMQMESCESRLQDLEHVLCLENFQASMKTQFQEEKQLQPSIQTVRNAAPMTFLRSTTSPELKKKLFTPPDFLTHTPHCQCFTCTNLLYQHLTFSCIHLRAQFYKLLQFTMEADQHFEGGSMIKLKLDQIDSAKNRQHKQYAWKRCQSFTVDYLLYLLDLSMFFIDLNLPELKEDAMVLIENALEIASENDLAKYCVSVFANELYYQNYIYDISPTKLSIAVPYDIPIDITNQPGGACITPKQQIEKVSRNLRRKSPPALAIPIITLSDASDENNCENSSVQKPANNAIVMPQITKRSSARNVRRKILVDEIEEAAEKQEPIQTRKRSTRLMKKSTS